MKYDEFNNLFCMCVVFSPSQFIFSQGHIVSVDHNSSGQNSTSSSSVGSKMPPLIRDLLSSLDDKEWQHSLFNLLQNQTYNQCEVDLFELVKLFSIS